MLEIELRKHSGIAKKLLIVLMKLKPLIFISKYKIIKVNSNETIVKVMKLFDAIYVGFINI